MKVKRLTPIDWLTALDRLSVGAFHLLSTLWYKDLEISDKTLMIETGFGVSTHRKHKKELIDARYIASKQIGKGVYRYNIGENVDV